MSRTTVLTSAPYYTTSIVLIEHLLKTRTNKAPCLPCLALCTTFPQGCSPANSSSQDCHWINKIQQGGANLVIAVFRNRKVPRRSNWVDPWARTLDTQQPTACRPCGPRTGRNTLDPCSWSATPVGANHTAHLFCSFLLLPPFCWLHPSTRLNVPDLNLDCCAAALFYYVHTPSAGFLIHSFLFSFFLSDSQSHFVVTVTLSFGFWPPLCCLPTHVLYKHPNPSKRAY